MLRWTSWGVKREISSFLDVGALRGDSDSFDTADAILSESRILESEDAARFATCRSRRRRHFVPWPWLF